MTKQDDRFPLSKENDCASQDVGELLQWIEIHAGTDREVWQWWPGGLLCCVNGLACEVRYGQQPLADGRDGSGLQP